MSQTNLEQVVGRLLRRYANPERKVFAYLFRLHPEADFAPMLPNSESVIESWIDEGEGLTVTPTATALARMQAIMAIVKPRVYNAANHTSLERKQLLSRSVLFSLRPLDTETIEVHLYSRAVLYTPKGDHDGYEVWRHDADGEWYFDHRPGED
jgi:hypothetical protein